MAEEKGGPEEFLKICHLFKLGMLTTEAPHPETVGLSKYACEDIITAINMLKNVDKLMIKNLKEKFFGEGTTKLVNELMGTVKSGNKIFLLGCGATGRLSHAIETLWRQTCREDSSLEKYQDSIVGVIAGGDVALIKAVEDFEDHPEFAPQQLIDLSYKDGDILIASTESGVTPWVIGAAQWAADKYVEGKSRKPFFVYCNPDDILIENVERSRDVLLSLRIEKLNLTVGPMGITGSTRMQASTALMLILGLAAFFAIKAIAHPIAEDFTFVYAEESKIIDKFSAFFSSIDLSILSKFIEAESAIYKEGNYLFYETTPDYAISVLTDTTERSPTFSLFPFENNLDSSDYKLKCSSLCHLLLCQKEGQEEIKDGWKAMLAGRELRPLIGTHWGKYTMIGSMDRLLGHIFTREIIKLREEHCKKGTKHYFLRIEKIGSNLILTMYIPNPKSILLQHSLDISAISGNPLVEHVFLKILLNIQSTLVMGRMGRYESNMMTYVRPSNNKLVDRSIRYTQHLLNQNKDKIKPEFADEYSKIGYKEVCYALFNELKTASKDEPIVLKTFSSLIKKYL